MSEHELPSARLADLRAAHAGCYEEGLCEVPELLDHIDWQAARLVSAQEALRQAADLAKVARNVAAAPDYDEVAISEALWAVVGAVLAGTAERQEAREPFVLTLDWECETCGLRWVMDAPGFPGDGHYHYTQPGNEPCGPIYANRTSTRAAEPPAKPEEETT